MASIVDQSSNLATDAMAAAIQQALANLDLARVPDSYPASRYAVSAVDQAGVPKLTGAQVGGNTGTLGPAQLNVVGQDSVQAATTANLVLLQLLNDVANPANTALYSTDPVGARGWHTLFSMLNPGAGITLTAAPTGIVTIAANGAGTFQSTAVGNIASNTVVAATAGGVMNPSLATSTEVPAIVGIAFTSATSGNPITVMTAGQITEALWSWTPGEPIYCGLTGGTLTQTAPSVDAVVVVGVALSATTINVQIGMMYLRN